jgi:transcriptional regulator with XRE-family HTH domain
VPLTLQSQQVDGRYRRTRYPREALHWCASRRRRRERVAAFCSAVDAVLARRIRAERVQAGLRQVDLADALGTSQSTISRIESGRIAPTMADLVRIAIQLNRPLEAFVRPPRPGPRTGWERHPTVPLIPRQLLEAALRGELPEEHEIYD